VTYYQIGTNILPFTALGLPSESHHHTLVISLSLTSSPGHTSRHLTRQLCAHTVGPWGRGCW